MRGVNRAALTTLTGVYAAFLLVSCSTMPPAAAQGYGQSRTEIAAPPVAGLDMAPATAPPIAHEPFAPPAAPVSYPRYGDSDDYLCNFAPPGDPRTPAACIRLRGPDALPQPPAHYGDTDDFLCNHGTPGDPHTTQACQRLRPPEH